MQSSQTNSSGASISKLSVDHYSGISATHTSISPQGMINSDVIAMQPSGILMKSSMITTTANEYELKDGASTLVDKAFLTYSGGNITIKTVGEENYIDLKVREGARITLTDDNIDIMGKVSFTGQYLQANRILVKSLSADNLEKNISLGDTSINKNGISTGSIQATEITTGTLRDAKLENTKLPHIVTSEAEVGGVWKAADIPVGCITLAAFYQETSIRRVGQQFVVSESAANDTTPNTGICTASLPYKYSSASRLRVLSRGKLGAGRYITMSEPIEDDDTYGMDNTTKVMVVLVQRIA